MRQLPEFPFGGRLGLGSSQIMLAGILLVGLMVSSFAIDLPMYYAAQNQLQTAVNAAALAGAAELPVGELEAEETAYEYASENLVAGQEVQPEDLSYNYDGTTFEVDASMEVPTLMSRLLCAFQGAGGGGGGGFDPEGEGSEAGGEEDDGSSASSSDCSFMTVAAHAKAVPAARDTILVIDNSSSMHFLGNGRPLKDVKNAATAYVDRVREMDGTNSVDRIGLVIFAYDATLVVGLKSQNEDPDFSKLRSAISYIKIYNAQGWNTNYEAPLKVALNELEKNGRKNADKQILFMTDGLPNLPAPPAFYKYRFYQPYEKCFDLINQNPKLSELCYRRNGVKICPKFPHEAVTARYISDAGQSCGLEYTDYLQTAVEAQVDRAEDLEVTIHTISIVDETAGDNATTLMRRMIKDMDWDPALLDYMADNTDGQQYQAAGYDYNGIEEIYNTIAQDVRMKLSD